MEESKSLRVEVISTETIKPSSPSPNSDHQGVFKLSLLDQFTTPFHIPFVLFYKGTTCFPPGERSQRLKSSLSNTLTRFYPFAGRLKDALTISCNDEGVEYSEARVLNCYLVDVLEKPNLEELNLFVPKPSLEDLATCPLILVRVSFFKCGGMALGFKFSHKIADATTFSSFVSGWVDSALGNADPTLTPDFSASSLFPPADSLPPSPQIQPNHYNLPPPTTALRTARFVFGPSELASLKANPASTNNPRPSRFEAVIAFIVKTALISKNEERTQKPIKIMWSVNLRSRLQPPLPESCFGNLVGEAVHDLDEFDGNDLPSLAAHLRRGTVDACKGFIQTTALESLNERVAGIIELQMNERELKAKKDGGIIELYMITSWCKLPMFEADFGWGKPLWGIYAGSHPIPNMIGLMDTRDGNGVEVSISLTEEEMVRFESNQELQKYASFNPSVF